MEEIEKVVKSFDTRIGQSVSIHGRIASVRKMKRYIFCDVFNKDVSIQVQFPEQEISYFPTAGDWVELHGKCFLTKTGEPTIKIESLGAISKWAAARGYKTLSPATKNTPLKAFVRGAYSKSKVPFLIRNHARDYLRSVDFIEVQTPVLCRGYNGGRSFPVTTHYLESILGFNRGTMEERMQALAGMGFDKIFQIGSIFRSSTEQTFLEGYVVGMSWQEGENLIRALCQHIARKMEEGSVSNSPFLTNLIHDDWQVLNYHQEAIALFGDQLRNLLNSSVDTFKFFAERGLIQKSEVFPETMADTIANLIVSKQTIPTILTNFPRWSSPLYAHDTDDHEFGSLQRSRMYLPGQKGGFDIGLQENNYESFITRTTEQAKIWKLNVDDPRLQVSELREVISAGLPSMFGFGMSPDRLSILWGEGASIDPFN